MTTILIVLYCLFGFGAWLWPCRTELPPRSAVFFAVLWPVLVAAIAIHQANKWTELAFSWAVERLD